MGERTIKIGGVEVSGEKTFVIAEIGSNHNGSLNTAKRLIHIAKESGADAVKFQTYKAERLINKKTPLMAHVTGPYKTQQERFRSLEFTHKEWLELVQFAKNKDIIFLSTPFDVESADFLDTFVPAFKIASGDLNNPILIRHVVKKNKPIILSTGMSTTEEIAVAIKKIPKDKLILLHCVSLYPAEINEVNLRNIPFLMESFGVLVGYSDHTIGITACLAAVAMGAVVIEKHFTENKNQDFGDHKLSAEPDEFAEIVSKIRDIERMKGSYQRIIGEKEEAMRKVMRRSLAAARSIKAGEKITLENIILIRPEKGISVAAINSVLEKTAKRNINKGEFIFPEDINETSS